MRTERNTKIGVQPTGDHLYLQPITLIIDNGSPITGPFSFQDYLTTQEALTLGRRLIEVAEDIEERQNAAMDDARAAAPDFHVEDDGGAEDERAAA